MTRYQYEVYKAIKSYIDEKGYSPSMRDLCRLTNKKSSATIWLHMKNLRKNGYIDYEDGKGRTIKITKDYKCRYE